MEDRDTRLTAGQRLRKPQVGLQLAQPRTHFMSGLAFRMPSCKKHSLLSPFLKKRRGYFNRLRPSVMLSPPTPLDEIPSNFVCELLRRATANIFWPHPLRPCVEVKRSKYHLITLKSQFQRFLYHTLCVYLQIKYINISNGSFVLLLRSCSRGRSWGRRA